MIRYKVFHFSLLDWFRRWNQILRRLGTLCPSSRSISAGVRNRRILTLTSIIRMIWRHLHVGQVRRVQTWSFSSYSDRKSESTWMDLKNSCGNATRKKDGRWKCWRSPIGILATESLLQNQIKREIFSAPFIRNKKECARSASSYLTLCPLMHSF